MSNHKEAKCCRFCRFSRKVNGQRICYGTSSGRYDCLVQDVNVCDKFVKDR